MTNKSKDLGTRWETSVVRWLQENGFPDARRNVLTGRFDSGDIEPIPATSPPIVISAKWGYAKDVHPQTLLFGRWWTELENVIERRNPDAMGLLCHHREGKASPESAHWYLYDSWHAGVIKVTGPQALRAMSIHSGYFRNAEIEEFE